MCVGIWRHRESDLEHRIINYDVTTQSEIPCRVNRKGLAHDSYIGEAYSFSVRGDMVIPREVVRRMAD